MGCLKSKEEKIEAPVDLNQSQPKKVDPRLPYDTYRQVFNMKNQWKAVSRNMEDTALDCLIRYFRLHPEHKALHKGLDRLEDEEQMKESTAFQNVAMAIFDVFADVIQYIENVDMALNVIKMAGKAHAKIPGFDTCFFKDMETSFMAAVKETMGDRFTEPTEENFYRLYRFVTEHMITAMGGPTPPKSAPITEPSDKPPSDPVPTTDLDQSTDPKNDPDPTAKPVSTTDIDLTTDPKPATNPGPKPDLEPTTDLDAPTEPTNGLGPTTDLDATIDPGPTNDNSPLIKSPSSDSDTQKPENRI